MKLSFPKSPLIGLLCLSILVFASLGGLAHNHQDDPLHLKPHDSCPVSVCSHTPFGIANIAIFLLVIHLVIENVTCSYLPFVLERYSFAKSSRAPPA